MKYNVFYMFVGLLLCSVLLGCGGKSDAVSVSGADSVPVDEISVPRFDTDSAMAFLQNQVKLGCRIPGSEPHKKCGDYILTTMKSIGADTVIDSKGEIPTLYGKTFPVRNILAKFNVAAPKRILLLAHYDTRPWADQDIEESNRIKPIDGANDGASGVAVLIEVARIISATAPSIGVDFLFVDVEDSGSPEALTGVDDIGFCFGSRHWAASAPYSPEEMPAYGILLDMVGDANAVFPKEYQSFRAAPDIVNKVWAIAAKTPYASRFPDRIGGAIEDDHIYINQAGIPCIDIIDCENGLTGGFPATWHTLNDNLSNIDPGVLESVGQVLLEVIYSEPIK